MALRMTPHLADALPKLVFEPVPVRLRAYLDGAPVVGTDRGVLVGDPRRFGPISAVPEADLRMEVAATDPRPAPPPFDALPPVLGPDSFEPHTTPGVVVDLIADGRRLPRA